MQLSIFSKSIPVLLAGLILSGCGTPVLRPSPEALNFEQVAKDPAPLIKQDYTVNVGKDGVKGVKKLIVTHFQVRFRDDLTGKYSKSSSYTIGDYKYSSTASIQDSYSVKGDEVMFQKVTDDLYKRFVSDLKKQGYEVDGMGAFVNRNPDLKNNIKRQLSSGWQEKLLNTGPVSCTLQDCGEGNGSGTESLLGLSWFGETSRYYIMFPSEVPAYVFSGLTRTMLDYDHANGGVLGAQTDEKVGYVSVVFDVELMKFERGVEKGFMSSKIVIYPAPMIRTQLHSFYAGVVPNRSVAFSFGTPPMISILPQNRGMKREGLTSFMNGKLFGYPWVELDEGAVTAERTIVVEGVSVGEVIPVPSKFPATFKKTTEPLLQVINHVITHPGDY